MSQLLAARLMSVEVISDFYPSGKSPDFAFVPTPQTTQLLRNLKMNLRATSFGFMIGAQIQSQIDATTFVPFIDYQTPFRLSFYLQLNNPDLLSFAQLPVDQESLRQRIFYLSNRFDKEEDINGNSTLLLSGHANNDSFVSELDLVRPVGSKFKYTLPQADATVTITDTFSGETVWPTPDSPQGDGLEIICELESLPDGRYTLQASDLVPSVIDTLELYKDDGLLTAGAFAVLDLYSDSPVADYAFSGTQGPDNVLFSRSYAIQFLTRSSIWQYYLILQTEDLDHDMITLVPSDNSITFSEEPAAQQVIDRYGADSVQLLQSDSEIPFRQAPELRVSYELDPPGQGTSDVTTGFLPFPTIQGSKPLLDGSGNLILDGNGNPQFYSEMYILF